MLEQFQFILLFTLEISKTQDDEVGDGTTTVAVLAGELLREGEKLVAMKIHPQHIIKGWRIAKDVAKETLQSLARDNSQDMAKFKEDLMNIARTTLSSKLLQQDKVYFILILIPENMTIRKKTKKNIIF